MAAAHHPRQALIDAAASQIAIDFDDYNASFADITRRAARRFKQRDWAGQQLDTRERIELYDRCIAASIGRLEALLVERLLSRKLWTHIQRSFADLIAPRLDAELYKTYFNTISRRLFKIQGVDAGIEFIALDIEPTEHITRPVQRNIYSAIDSDAQAVSRLLQDSQLYADDAQLLDDAGEIALRLRALLQERGDEQLLSLEMLQVVFYRDQRAYLIGRLFGSNSWSPCIICLVHDEQGIHADAVLTRRLDVSRLFGFTYSYFLADLPTVGDTILFLRLLLPDKPVDELYTVLGRLKQGKTERYRHFVHHCSGLLQQQEQFQLADGQRGMVLAVFTLPSYPLVFKVIRDHFGPTKKMFRSQVLEQYRLVFHHERAGRLIDAQEYRHLAFARHRFPDHLLAELGDGCRHSVSVRADEVIIHHCFVQRRVRPLDLYIAEVSPEQASAQIIDYGQAIKDLAACNLFPGDLFLKNFGVTRSGRTVFYDYDEVSLLSRCRFRRLPRPRHAEEELSDEIWFNVEPEDVFPEQFQRFMDIPPQFSGIMQSHHPELFEIDWWLAMQQAVQHNNSSEPLPYSAHTRLA